MARAVCQVAFDRVSVLLALELPVQEQPALDTYPRSEGSPEDQRALRMGAVGHRPRQDGRTRRAVLEPFRLYGRDRFFIHPVEKRGPRSSVGKRATPLCPTEVTPMELLFWLLLAPGIPSEEEPLPGGCGAAANEDREPGGGEEHPEGP